MIHLVDSPTLILPPPALGDDAALGDVLRLAALEEVRWPSIFPTIKGPTAVSFISTASVVAMRKPLAEGALWEARLHIGNPGAAGTANIAAESTKKLVNGGGGGETWSTAPARAMSNAQAFQWPEVKATETYTFVTLWTSFTTFMGYGELAVTVPATVGDTVRFNVGSLIIEWP